MAMGRRHANILQGGLMRCCIQTIVNDADKAPLEPNVEGEILQCEYTSDESHQMLYKEGAWRWYYPKFTGDEADVHGESGHA